MCRPNAVRVSTKPSPSASTTITGTTTGTPWIDLTSGRTPRSWFKAYTAPNTTTATTTILSTTSWMGAASRPRLRRPDHVLRLEPANDTTATTPSTQPHSGGTLLFSSAVITGSTTAMLPPEPMRMRTTPWKARNAASVATNDGMPTFATMNPR